MVGVVTQPFPVCDCQTDRSFLKTGSVLARYSYGNLCNRQYYYQHRLHFHHWCDRESRARSKRKMEGGRDSKRRLTDSGAAAAMAAQTPPTYAPVTHALLPPPHQIAPHPMHCPFRRRSTGRAADSGTGTAASATRSRQPIRLHHLPSFPSTLELVGHYG